MEVAGSVVGPYLDDFEQFLRERRYQPSTAHQYVVHCQTFDSFLVDRHIALASLQQIHIEEFVQKKLAERPHRNDREAAQRWHRPICLLVEHLSGSGLVSMFPRPAVSDPAILAGYLGFLRDHRGICQKTVASQQRHLTQFLKVCAVSDDSSVARISVEQIDDFLIQKARHLSRASVNNVCSALRGFLSYLHMRGLLDRNLAEQVTQPRLYRLSSLPRAIAWKDVERTLGIPDRRTLIGCRDYAVLALLSYCGLRAGEVAALRLDDLDWSHDTIRVYRSKRETMEYLPLAPVVGEALIGYLKRRPASVHRQLFLKVLAPEGPLSRPSITWLARKYLQSAGIQGAHLGAHTLRSLVCRLAPPARVSAEDDRRRTRASSSTIDIHLHQGGGR
jgi:site-specific recombinase XerD